MPNSRAACCSSITSVRIPKPEPSIRTGPTRVRSRFRSPMYRRAAGVMLLVSRASNTLMTYPHVCSMGSGHWLETERWPAALRSGLPLGIVYLDLDHLQARNDQHGHALGDLYIQEAANALRQASRQGVDEVFRLYTAGDEFLLILHGPLDPDRVAQALIERLRNYGVSASIGLAYSTETRYLPARVELRQAAERACRQAKKLGGDRAIVVMTVSQAGEVSHAWGNEAAEAAETSDNIPEAIDAEPMAGRISASVRPLRRLPGTAVAP